MQSSRSIWALVVFLFVAQVRAETIEFPEEELATESVLPVFDLNVSVRNRSVYLTKRLEVGVGVGYSLLEPFFVPYSLCTNITYQWNEEQGINFWGSLFMEGPSDYSRQLNPIPPTTSNANLQLAPAAKYMGIMSYQYSAFYGKISLSKNYVMRMTLFGLAGLGMIGVGDSNNILASVGIGQRFYFSDRFSLRLDLRVYTYNGPDILSKGLQNETSTKSASFFSQKMLTGSVLGLSFAYLFK